MTDWVATLIPVGSLLAGSALTIAGQALVDRRTLRREREARRDDFKQQNFEFERQALHELQEILANFSTSAYGEFARRKSEGDESFYDGANSKLEGILAVLDGASHLVPNTEKLVVTVDLATSNLEEHLKVLRAGVEKAVIESRLEAEAATLTTSIEESEVMSRMNEITNAIQECTEFLRKMEEYMQRRKQLAPTVVEFNKNARLRMYRSGSNSVVEAGDDYITAAIRWYGAIGSRANAELFDVLRKQEYEFNRVISNALHDGPI